VRFWDASAVVPLLIQQQRTTFASRLWGADPEVAVWWGTRVECHSAIARTLRQNAIDRAGAARGIERLSHIESQWLEVEPSVAVRDEACRLLRAHPLRAADALQLAAALRLSDEIGDRVAMICFDARLADAARLEQLPIVDVDEAR
jgi:predicted nucleic acid-binding protein